MSKYEQFLPVDIRNSSEVIPDNRETTNKYEQFLPKTIEKTPVNKTGDVSAPEIKLNKEKENKLISILKGTGSVAKNIFDSLATSEGREIIGETFKEVGIPSAKTALFRYNELFYDKLGFEGTADEQAERAEKANNEARDFILSRSDLYDPTDERGFLEKLTAEDGEKEVSKIIGAQLPILGTIAGIGLVSKGVGVPATVGALGTSFAFNSGDAYQQGLDYLEENDIEKTEEWENRLQNISIMVGVTTAPLDALATGKLLSPKNAGVVKQTFTRHLINGFTRFAVDVGTEAGTEGAQEIIQNAWALTYNEHQDILEGVAEATFGGGLFGGGVSTINSVISSIPNATPQQIDKIRNSQAFDIERAIDAGDIQASDVYTQTPIYKWEGSTGFEQVLGDGSSTLGDGQYFATDKKSSKAFGNTLSEFALPEVNILDVTQSGDNSFTGYGQHPLYKQMLVDGQESGGFLNYVKQQGFDGVKFQSDDGNATWIALSPDVEVDTFNRILKPEVAQGRVDDIAQKLNYIEKGLGEAFRNNVDINNSTEQSLAQEGVQVLQNFEASVESGDIQGTSILQKVGKPLSEPVAKQDTTTQTTTVNQTQGSIDITSSNVQQVIDDVVEKINQGFSLPEVNIQLPQVEQAVRRVQEQELQVTPENIVAELEKINARLDEVSQETDVPRETLAGEVPQGVQDTPIEVIEDAEQQLAGFESINPTLLSRVDKVDTAEEFVQLISRDKAQSVQGISEADLTDFFNRVQALRTIVSRKTESTPKPDIKPKKAVKRPVDTKKRIKSTTKAKKDGSKKKKVEPKKRKELTDEQVESEIRKEEARRNKLQNKEFFAGSDEDALFFNRPDFTEKEVRAVLSWQAGNRRAFPPALVAKLKEAQIGLERIRWNRDGKAIVYRDKGRIYKGKPHGFSVRRKDRFTQIPYEIDRRDALVYLNSPEWRRIVQKALPKKDAQQALKQLDIGRVEDEVTVLGTARIQPRDKTSNEVQAERENINENASKLRRSTTDRQAETYVAKLNENEPQKTKYSESELSKGNIEDYEALVRRSDIAEHLIEKLNATVRRGKFRKSALGIHKPDSGVIRLSKSRFTDREGGEFTTLVHELGHYVDASVERFSDSIPADEVKPLLQNYGKGADSVPVAKRRKEAFAEFMRYYVTIPEQAKEFAPEFSKIMEEKFKDYPEMADAFKTAQTDFIRWADQPSVAKVASQISFERKDDKGGVRRRLNTKIHELYRDAVNDLHPLSQFSDLAKKTVPELEASQDPYILARNLRGWVGRATYFLESGAIRREFWKKGANGKFYIDKVGKSLKEILQPVENAGAMQDLSIYLVAKRAIELDSRDIRTGITVDEAKDTVKFMESKHKGFKDTLKDLQEYQDHLLTYLRDSGVISSDNYKSMKEANKYYVPYFRVHEQLNNKGYMGGRGIPTRSPIKKIKGSEKEIIDPLESIVKNTYALINSAERNNVMQAMANLTEDNKEISRLFERVPADQVKVASVNTKDVVKNAFAGTNSGEVQQAIETLNPEEMVNIFRPAFMQRGNVVSVMVDGKLQYYEVEPELYNALNSMEVEEAVTAVKLLSYPAQFLRAGATLTPEFMLRNPLRDTFTASIFSKYGFIPVFDTLRGLSSVIKKDEFYQAWLISGGELASLVAQDRQDMKKTRDELLKRSARIKKYVKSPIEVLRAISAYTEQATRVGEARLALRQGKTPTEASFASREVSLDFLRSGAKMRALNKLSAFFNAKIQGNDKLVRKFRDNAFEASMKSVLYITLPSVILYFLNRDEEGWDEIPQWQKDLFWLVKVGDTWYRIPKPFELGLIFGSLPERMLEFIDKRDPEAMREIAHTIGLGVIPNPTPTGAIPIIENTTNYSFFLDRPIVSPALENLPAESQYTNTTSETAKIMGDLFNYSPAKIENLLYGYFAGLGRHVVDSTDAILKGTGIVHSVTEPEDTLADKAVFKAFVVREPTGSSSKSIDTFYRFRDKATRARNQFKVLSEEGKTEEAQEYFEKHPEIQLYSSYNRVAKQLSDLRKARNAVYEHETMTAKQKREKIDELNALMTDLAHKAINIELK